MPLAASAQTVYINETFDTDTIGIAPTDAAQKYSSQTLVQAGSGVMGTDRLAQINDATGSAGGIEYNVGTSALGTLYTSFDLFNNAPSGTGNGTQPLIFGIGAWNSSASLVMNANATRYFGLEFFALGTTQTFKLRVGGSAVYTSVYNPSEVQHVQVWINDHNSNALSYTRPDNFQTASLSANSVVVYINNVLYGASATGYAIQQLGDMSDATMGRVSFISGSSTVSNFSIDNLYVAAPIPEPSTYAAIAGFAALGLCVWQRRRTRQA